MITALAIGLVAISHPRPAISQYPPVGAEVALKTMVTGLTAPVAMVPSPDKTGRMFIVDQTGLIWIMKPDGTVFKTPFLDVRSEMVSLRPGYDERGLLGLAFHPDFANNGKFYVYYSGPLRDGAPPGWDHTAHIAEFKVSNDPNVADPNSERTVMLVDEPQLNHNGGTLIFGPDDGYLYISLGDGGAANDQGLGHGPHGNGQDINVPLGKILRIDVDHGDPYAIPPDNPFVGKDGLDEIYAYGFRNPYRMAFDSEGSHRLFIGDVGQNLYEELDIGVLGGNFGWNIREGNHCFDPNNPNDPPPTCSDTGYFGEPLLFPVIEYSHPGVDDHAIGLVIVCGYVYHGSLLKNIRGRFVFGDWSTDFGAADGTLLVAKETPRGDWQVQKINIVNSPNKRINKFIMGFGQDNQGEIYVLAKTTLGPTGDTGVVYKMVKPGAAVH